jgi:hypothetical protein
MKNMIVILLLSSMSVAGYLVYQKQFEKNEKQAKLFKQARSFAGYTKPRSTFVLRRAYEKNENTLKITVEVVGPFDNYEFKWWLPSGVLITSGEESGYVDATQTKVFTHAIEFANINEGEQIVFETFTNEEGNKQGATLIYTHGEVIAEEENSIMGKSAEKPKLPVKVMQ